MPGSQINTPRGTRVFFGFSSAMVPMNTVIGTTEIRIAGSMYVDRTVRFNNNSMDVVNLPIPEQNGVATYLNTFLVFTRELKGASGLDRFTLTVTDAAGVADLKLSSANSIDLSMHGGREYGLLF